MSKLNLEFEWDEQKNIKNQEKHRIKFEDVIAVFKYPMFKEIDERYDYGEVRFIGIGKKITVYFTIVYSY